MNKLKVFTLFILVITLLAACGDDIKNDTMEDTAKTFIQAIIDGDTETVEALNRDQAYPTAEIMQKLGPKLAGMKLEDLELEFDEVTNEYQFHINAEDGGYYWLTIELIGEEYFVTNV